MRVWDECVCEREKGGEGCMRGWLCVWGGRGHMSGCVCEYIIAFEINAVTRKTRREREGIQSGQK